MMLTKFVRIQLTIFAVLTVVGLIVMATQYVRVPAMVGIGRYDVTVELPATGGLYKNSNVTYRGQTIGVVNAVELSETGVNARLSLASGVKVPSDVDAAVKSVSAIGEQFVDLIPHTDSSGAIVVDGHLENGSVIPEDRTSIPQDVGAMLDQADLLLQSISDTKLKTVIDESFKAFNGAGPDLQKLIDSARLFVEEANNNSDATKTLIEQAGPLLDTQVVSSDAIRSWTSNLVTFTDQLRASDPDLRAVIQKGPAAAAEANALLQDMQPTLPILLANLVSVGQVGVIYNNAIEQILVIYPPLAAALVTVAGSGPAADGALVDFHMEVNDPPPCPQSSGAVRRTNHRSRHRRIFSARLPRIRRSRCEARETFPARSIRDVVRRRSNSAVPATSRWARTRNPGLRNRLPRPRARTRRRLRSRLVGTIRLQARTSGRTEGRTRNRTSAAATSVSNSS